VFIDYLRNSRGATSIASCSTRARHGAPVAAPLRWEELSSTGSSDKYDVQTMTLRLKSKRIDPWKGYFEVRQHLSAALLREFRA
jgi:bifunctional non-homologous end joining protein LigD